MLKSLQHNPLFSWLKTHGSNLLIFALFVVGIMVFYRQIQHINPHDLLAQLKALPVSKFILAFIFTLGGYLALVGYDWSALRYIGKKLPLPFIAFTSFIGYSLSNTIGISWLSGGAVRYRLYSRVGLSSKEIALIIAFCVVGFGIGEVLVGGLALVIHPFVFADYFSIPSWIVRTVAFISLGFVVGSLVLRSRRNGEIKWKQSTFKIPSTQILTGQIVFSMMDIGFAGAALYILLPDSQLPFLTFLAVYAVALVISVLSHVPGGVGVFEAVIIAALQNSIPIDAITVALVSYRAIYYILPFLFGLLLLVVGEGYISIKKRLSGSEQLEGTLRNVATVASGTIPAAVSGITLFSGVLLLIGSSFSLTPKTLHLLEDFWPLELFELSHILGGVIGMILILLSFALWQRVRAALWLASFLFVVGAILSFIQTLDYDRAVVLILALALLVLGRKQFYRRARLFSGVFNIQWFLITLAAVAGFLWLLFFSFKATPYQDYLWWEFAFNDQVSRGLRTITAAISTYIVLYIIYALRPLKKDFEHPDKTQLIKAEAIVRQQDNADANFVLTGDKYLMWSENQSAFIMFGTQGRSWIALGDPVGSSIDAYELLWQFKQQAEDNRCRAVFYQVSSERLDWYINAGFNLFKLGEEAIVDLNEFSLEGSKRKRLRQSHHRAERDGLSFSLAYPPHSPELFDQLEAISNNWLESKEAREKGFSLGKFDRDYLAHFPIALIHENEQISAFANVLVTDTKQESSIDLMRYNNDASVATMEYLFIKLMLALKEEGYANFNLGMAPLSGLEDRKGARKWDKFGSLIYKSGGEFYNFDGLRQFKNKFKPEWKPKYLAANKGVNPYIGMVEIAALISGNLLGVIKK